MLLVGNVDYFCIVYWIGWNWVVVLSGDVDICFLGMLIVGEKWFYGYCVVGFCSYVVLFVEFVWVFLSGCGSLLKDFCMRNRWKMKIN